MVEWSSHAVPGQERVMRLTIESLVHGGLGLARSEGVVFVPYTVPGETVEAEIFERKKGYAFARLVKVLEPSPHRVEPPCPVFGRCGGCHLQHMAYGAQVEAKQAILAETFRRTAKMEVAPGEPLTGEPFGYRRRAVFKVSPSGEIGFFGRKSNAVVAIERCLLLVPELHPLLAGQRARPDLREGITEIEAAAGLDGVVLFLPSGGWSKPRLSGLAQALPGVIGIRDGKSRGSVGDTSVRLSPGGPAYRVQGGDFFQANQGLNAALVDAALADLAPLEGASVLDAYAGAGNFTLPLAGRAARVTAVEGNASAAEDAKANAERAGLSNCMFLSGALETVRLSPPPSEKLSGGPAVRRSGRFDAAVLDPPRTGLSPQALERLAALAPQKILYVSCDPATLARDARGLVESYALASLRLADMFPQTYHLEALALFHLRPS